MHIAIVGAGRVGRALGSRWSQVGHDVHYGVRNPDDPKNADLSTRGTVKESLVGADVALIALPWAATRDTLSAFDFGDTVLLDATNPLAASARELVADSDLSGAELIRDWSRSSRVVKAFNTTGSANMVNPDYGNVRPMMPISGDDDAAKQLAIGLANEIGFDGFDAGPLSASRDLEHLAMLWIRLAFPLGNGTDIAFSLLRR